MRSSFVLVQIIFFLSLSLAKPVTYTEEPVEDEPRISYQGSVRVIDMTRMSDAARAADFQKMFEQPAQENVAEMEK